MYEIVDIKDINELYNFQNKLNIPYMFHVDFEEWKKSIILECLVMLDMENYLNP